MKPFSQPVIAISGLSKTYASGFQALKKVDLEIRRGEIFALLGPNGAGKTTMINIICGVVNASEGVVRVDGMDIVDDYRAVRSMIGLVPQELTTNAFEKVQHDVAFTRGLFGKRANPALVERFLCVVGGQGRVPTALGRNRGMHLVSDAELSRTLEGPGRDYWREFSSRFPDAAGVVRASPVAYSTDGMEAMVYVAFAGGILDAHGDAMVLRSVSGRWYVVDHVTTWSS